MGKPDTMTEAVIASRAAAVRPGINDGLQWLTIQKLPDGKWHVLELHNGVARSVGAEYYRDLIEQTAGRRMRSLGR